MELSEPVRDSQIDSDVKNTIPQDGYTLFSRKESTRNQEICEIGTESSTSSEDEDANDFLNYMASKFDQGKLRKFRRNI